MGFRNHVGLPVNRKPAQQQCNGNRTQNNSEKKKPKPILQKPKTIICKNLKQLETAPTFSKLFEVFVKIVCGFCKIVWGFCKIVLGFCKIVLGVCKIVLGARGSRNCKRMEKLPPRSTVCKNPKLFLQKPKTIWA